MNINVNVYVYESPNAKDEQIAYLQRKNDYIARSWSDAFRPITPADKTAKSDTGTSTPS